MNIVSLFSTMTSNDEGLCVILKIISDTLKELNIELDDINLGYSSIPYYDGVPSQCILPIIESIKKSDGIIILTTTPFGMPSSILQTFLEYLQLDQYKNIFNNKLCMIIVSSNNKNSIGSIGLNNVSSIMRSLGAFDCIRLEVDNYFLDNLNKDDFYKKYIENQIEDFYRIVNQKRKFYLPKTTNNFVDTQNNSLNIIKNNNTCKTNYNIHQNNIKFNNLNEEANKFLQVIQNKNNMSCQNNNLYNTNKSLNNSADFNTIKTLNNREINQNKSLNNINFDTNKYLDNNIDFDTSKCLDNNQPKVYDQNKNPSSKINEIYNNIAIENFNKTQQEDIDNITKLFSQKYQNISLEDNKNQENILKPLVPNITTETTAKNCRQLTLSLTHFYKPQIIPDMNDTIQLCISGEEGFKGYITIKNKLCEYIDGNFESPSTTIISPDDIWKNIITGKITAQKAFMMGQIKVRGNFVLITKFDKIFSFKKNII